MARGRVEAAARSDRTDQTPPQLVADLVVRAVQQRRFCVAPVQASLVGPVRARFAVIEEAMRRDSATAHGQA